MSKWRIKEVGLADGNVWYIPQWKCFFWWEDAKKDRKTISFGHIVQARRFIDEQQDPYVKIHKYIPLKDDPHRL